MTDETLPVGLLSRLIALLLLFVTSACRTPVDRVVIPVEVMTEAAYRASGHQPPPPADRPVRPRRRRVRDRVVTVTDIYTSNP